MLEINDAYKAAVKLNNRKSTIKGALTTTKGVEYPLNDSTFIKETFYITNQCVNNSALEFGAVYAGECGFTINSDIDRYTLFGATIEMSHVLTVGASEISVPLGVFTVDEATRVGSTIKIKALDAMNKFDITVNEDTNGLWYDMLKYVADKAGVELAQTQDELNALHANTASTYTIIQSRVDSYRDVLSYLCMVVCAFATIDRYGKLKIVQYGTTPVDSYGRENRINNCSFSDFTSEYGSVTARFVANENYYPYLAEDKDRADKLLLDIGDIPIVGGTPKTKQALMDNILATLTTIRYVPATLYIASNPCLELGDLIECKNINNSAETVNCYVMNYKFEYRSKETLKGYGENPLLQNVTDRTRRNVQSLEQQISAKEVVTVSYTNADAYKVKQELVRVAELRLSLNTDCKPIIIATVPFSLDVDAIVEFYIYNGVVPIDNAVYKGYYSAGAHFATICYIDDAKQGEIKNINIMVKAYADTTSKTRKQDAKIISLTNAITQLINGETASITDVDTDTTEPTLTIDKYAIKACAYTQGINGGSTWDGTLDLADEFGGIPVVNATMSKIIDTIATATQIPTSSMFTDSFNSISVVNATISGFTANIEFNAVIENYTIETTKKTAYTYNSKYMVADDAFKLNTAYSYTATVQTIDSGKMGSISIDLTPFASVEGVTLTNE